MWFSVQVGSIDGSMGRVTHRSIVIWEQKNDQNLKCLIWIMRLHQPTLPRHFFHVFLIVFHPKCHFSSAFTFQQAPSSIQGHNSLTQTQKPRQSSTVTTKDSRTFSLFLFCFLQKKIYSMTQFNAYHIK